MLLKCFKRFLSNNFSESESARPKLLGVTVSFSLLTILLINTFAAAALDSSVVRDRAFSSSTVPPSTVGQFAAPLMGIRGSVGGDSAEALLKNVEGITTGVPYIRGANGESIVLTLNPDLQLKAQELLRRYQVPWGAIVMVEPKTGRVLALAGYSERDGAEASVALRATFPAASLFKVITAAGGVERGGISSDYIVNFRGGDHSFIGVSNGLPDPIRDRRRLSAAEALGRSCNPAFARIGVKFLSGGGLERYALNFGFNSTMPFELPVGVSKFSPPTDELDLAKVSAGFGDVTVSPLHAAMIGAALGNKGVMMRPYMVERIVTPDGKSTNVNKPIPLRTVVAPGTASEVMKMMETTVRTGTGRRQFLRGRGPVLLSRSIAAKTGTLKGDNPRGINHWFMAVAPSEQPEVALATLVVDPGNARVKSSALARVMLETYFGERSDDDTVIERSAPRKPSIKRKRRKAANVITATKSRKSVSVNRLKLSGKKVSAKNSKDKK